MATTPHDLHLALCTPSPASSGLQLAQAEVLASTRLSPLPLPDVCEIFLSNAVFQQLIHNPQEDQPGIPI